MSRSTTLLVALRMHLALAALRLRTRAAYSHLAVWYDLRRGE